MIKMSDILFVLIVINDKYNINNNNLEYSCLH